MMMSAKEGTLDLLVVIFIVATWTSIIFAFLLHQWIILICNAVAFVAIFCAYRLQLQLDEEET